MIFALNIDTLFLNKNYWNVMKSSLFVYPYILSASNHAELQMLRLFKNSDLKFEYTVNPGLPFSPNGRRFGGH